jgi:hypothetical protein
MCQNVTWKNEMQDVMKTIKNIVGLLQYHFYENMLLGISRITNLTC